MQQLTNIFSLLNNQKNLAICVFLFVVCGILVHTLLLTVQVEKKNILPLDRRKRSFVWRKSLLKGFLKV